MTDGLGSTTGIRGVKLYILVAILCVLWFTTIGILVTNIFLLSALRIGYRGMTSLQFVRLGNGTSVVQFLAGRVELPFLRAAIVGGYLNQDLSLQSDDLSVKAGDATMSTVECGGETIRFKSKDGFTIVNSAAKRIFVASSPTIRLPPGIKRMASKQIIANKIRAPVNKTLKLEVQNLSFRGNEGNHFSGRNFALSANIGSVYLETAGNGSLRCKSGSGIRLSPTAKLLISESPSITSDILAKKLCLNKYTGYLFLSEGNKNCID